jgi:hypothetical protein
MCCSEEINQLDQLGMDLVELDWFGVEPTESYIDLTNSVPNLSPNRLDGQVDMV